MTDVCLDEEKSQFEALVLAKGYKLPNVKCYVVINSLGDIGVAIITIKGYFRYHKLGQANISDPIELNGKFVVVGLT